MDIGELLIPSQGWEDSRSVSEGSLTTSNEQLALIGFAYQLSSIFSSNDDIADEIDVRKEAKLLMSLSCSSPTYVEEQSGRITPPSDASSCYSTGSKRDSFCFTCPSLSLENHSRMEEEETEQPKSDSEDSPPSVLLGRSLKVDDRDALRLSAEAMGRNIMQSYKKALDWRIKSWEDALSRILVDKERNLASQNASEARMLELLKSGEANLLVALRELKEEIKVIDATTSFKVLPQRVTKEDRHEPLAKKARTETENTGIEEAEYRYEVSHMIALEGFLNIRTPAGYINIELQVPGTMTGTFLSTEECAEELTDVRMEVNTEILAAMIEKGSRKVVRASVEAVLKGDNEEKESEHNDTEEVLSVEKSEVETIPSSPKLSIQTSTPKRRVSEDRMSGLVLITPARDTSSPSSYGDSDNDEKPVLLSIPDNFLGSKCKPSLRMLTPQPSRPREIGSFTLSTQTESLPTVVTPHKTHHQEIIGSTKGPILPLLVEAACAAIRKK